MGLKYDRWFCGIYFDKLAPRLGVMLQAPFMIEVAFLWIWVELGYGALSSKEEAQLNEDIGSLRRKLEK